MTRAIIGLAVDTGELLAVRLDRNGGTGEHHRQHPGDLDFPDAVAAVLAGAMPRAGDADVHVVVADRRCRVGPLFGEAGASRTDVETRFFRDPNSYFAGAAEGWVAGAVIQEAEGWSGMVVDRRLIDALDLGADRVGVTIASLGPLPDGAMSLRDAARAIARARGETPGRLDRVGPDRRAVRRRRRIGLLVAGAVASLLALEFAPTLGTLHRARRLEAMLAREEAARLGPATADSEAWIVRSQETIETLTAGRGYATSVLDLLARALPDSVAVAALQVSPDAGSVTLVGIRVLQVLPVLEALGRFDDLRLAGAVTREDHGGTPFQRATLTWRREPPYNRSTDRARPGSR